MLEGDAEALHGEEERTSGSARRIEGQVRGLQRMVEEDKYCIDILKRRPTSPRA
jgi:DNA-binding FrmR family transcriptional regulator